MKTYKYRIVETPSSDVLLVLCEEDKEMVLGKFKSVAMAENILVNMLVNMEEGKCDFLGNIIHLEKTIEFEDK